MIELLKELATVLKEIPNAAIWIAGGLLFYKLAIVGSIYGLIKFGISAIKEMYLKPKEVRLRVGDHFVHGEECEDLFNQLLKELKYSHAQKKRYSYIFADHIENAIDLLRKQKNEDSFINQVKKDV